MLIVKVTVWARVCMHVTKADIHQMLLEALPCKFNLRLTRTAVCSPVCWDLEIDIVEAELFVMGYSMFSIRPRCEMQCAT
jgi:hypothetical protein